MKFKMNKKNNYWLLCAMLVAIVSFTSVGCGNNSESNDGNKKEEQTQEEKKDNVLGEGQTKFTFGVVDQDGKETNFEVRTDKKTVGEALLDVNMIEGEEGEYGLYVKTVNGITADYDKDQAYWAFYINDEYATTGVDLTDIEEGATYTFKIEKQ